jgi:hypothetical protein
MGFEAFTVARCDVSLGPANCFAVCKNHSEAVVGNTVHVGGIYTAAM